jgi:hypothetical protein
VHALSVVIQALEFEPVGPQNQWVDVMFLTVDSPTANQSGLVYCTSLLDPPPQIVPFQDGLSEGAYGKEEIEDIIGELLSP